MRLLATLALATALALPALGTAQQTRPAFAEVTPPVPVEAQGKVEVLEFFWYGCIHCYNLEPALETWIQKLPADTQFRRVPAVFNERWAHDARIFYTFEALGVLDKVHRAFFDAIHRDRLRTDNPKALAEWLGKNGIDAQKFNATMKSFGVESKTRRAAQITAAYKIEGTPSMAVHGRYTVSADGGHDGMLQTTASLIERVRKAR